MTSTQPRLSIRELKRIPLYRLAVATILIATAAWSHGALSRDPDLARVQSIELKKPGYHLRVVAEPNNRVIKLYRLGSPDPLPGEPSITLRSQDGTVQEVKLKSMGRDSTPGATQPPTYAASIDPRQLPVAGLEVRFHVGKTKETQVLDWHAENGK